MDKPRKVAAVNTLLDFFGERLDIIGGHVSMRDHPVESGEAYDIDRLSLTLIDESSANFSCPVKPLCAPVFVGNRYDVSLIRMLRCDPCQLYAGLT